MDAGVGQGQGAAGRGSRRGCHRRRGARRSGQRPGRAGRWRPCRSARGGRRGCGRPAPPGRGWRGRGRADGGGPPAACALEVCRESSHNPFSCPSHLSWWGSCAWVCRGSWSFVLAGSRPASYGAWLTGSCGAPCRRRVRRGRCRARRGYRRGARRRVLAAAGRGLFRPVGATRPTRRTVQDFFGGAGACRCRPLWTVLYQGVLAGPRRRRWACSHREKPAPPRAHSAVHATCTGSLGKGSAARPGRPRPCSSPV